jgi:hypothetical protein
MQISREVEIRNNYEFFQSVVGNLMSRYAGEYALIRSQQVVEYYHTAGEAVAEGSRRFGEMPFSVQHVINRPIDLGFLSHAADNGIAVRG